MSKIFTVLAGLAVIPMITLASDPVFAQQVQTGQIEGGDIYRVANTTKNITFTDPVTASCNDMVQFRVRIHNIGAFQANNVKVQATLPSTTATSHSSTVAVSSSNSNTVTDTAGVTLNTAGKLTYVSGSTELLDANQSKLSTMADGIIAGGVTLPTAVGVSTEQKRSVQFSAKVECPITPQPPEECKPGIPKGDQRCEDRPETPVTPTTPQPPKPTPTVLPNTGIGAFIGLAFSTMLGGGIAHRLVYGRR